MKAETKESYKNLVHEHAPTRKLAQFILDHLQGYRNNSTYKTDDLMSMEIYLGTLQTFTTYHALKNYDVLKKNYHTLERKEEVK